MKQVLPILDLLLLREFLRIGVQLWLERMHRRELNARGYETERRLIVELVRNALGRGRGRPLGVRALVAQKLRYKTDAVIGVVSVYLFLSGARFGVTLEVLLGTRIAEERLHVVHSLHRSMISTLPSTS